MIFCDKAIAIRETTFRESDKIVSLYTENHGRLDVILKSVKLSKSKLKSLSETFVLSDYRIYYKSEKRLPVCVGGETLCVFPGIRRDLSKMTLAFYFCEVMYFLTPVNQPSPEKYGLFLSALRCLDSGGIFEELKRVFMLRFMEISGYGFKKTAVGLPHSLWKPIHSAPLEEVKGLMLSQSDGDYLDSLINNFLGEHLKRPLASEKFLF